jgi:hypothetical protein
MRMENFLPGDPIVFQGAAPRAEDGHFTILTGECESVRFAEGSVPLLSLTSSVALRDWEQCTRIVSKGDVMAKFPRHSGFGELASLTNTKRTSTIRAAAHLASPMCQLLVPADSTMTPRTLASSSSRRRTASAMGERQIFPRHTVVMRIKVLAKDDGALVIKEDAIFGEEVHRAG